MGINERSIKNLKLFKKGESGNPKGAPKGKRWRTVLKELLEQRAIVPDKSVKEKKLKAYMDMYKKRIGRELTNRDAVAFSQFVKALEGNTQAFRALADREEGRPLPERKDMSDDPSPAASNLTDDQLDKRIAELEAKFKKGE
jgi:hypothetical protein